MDATVDHALRHAQRYGLDEYRAGAGLLRHDVWRGCTAFNALNRAKTDVNLDATALARYEPNAASTYEFGYARKTRSPNLYERYAWSTNRMASGMIGWFGDGNYYVGNVGLKPETANTVSGTARWHDRARKPWEIEADALPDRNPEVCRCGYDDDRDVWHEHLCSTAVRQSQRADLRG